MSSSFLSDTKSETFQYLLGEHYLKQQRQSSARNEQRRLNVGSVSFLTSMTEKFNKEAAQIYIHHHKHDHHHQHQQNSHVDGRCSSRFHNFLLSRCAADSLLSVMQIALAADLVFDDRNSFRNDSNFSTKKNGESLIHPPCLPLLKMLGHCNTNKFRDMENLNENVNNSNNCEKSPSDVKQPPTLQERINFIMLLDKQRKKSKKEKKMSLMQKKLQQENDTREGNASGEEKKSLKQTSSSSSTSSSNKRKGKMAEKTKPNSSVKSTTTASTTSTTSSSSDDDDEDDDDANEDEIMIDDATNNINNNDIVAVGTEEEQKQNPQLPIDKLMANNENNNNNNSAIVNDQTQIPMMTLENISFALSSAGAPIANNKNNQAVSQSQSPSNFLANSGPNYSVQQPMLNSYNQNPIMNSTSTTTPTPTVMNNNNNNNNTMTATTTNLQLLQQQQLQQSHNNNAAQTNSRMGSFAAYGSFNTGHYGANVQYVSSEAGSFRVPPQSQYHHHSYNNMNSTQNNINNMMTTNPFFFGSQNQAFSSGSAVEGDETPPVIASAGISRTNTTTQHNQQQLSSGMTMLNSVLLGAQPVLSTLSSPLVIQTQHQHHQRMSSNASSATFQHRLAVVPSQQQLPQNAGNNNNNNNPSTLMRHMRTASGVEKIHHFEQRWFDSPETASAMLLERLNNIISVLESLREQQEERNGNDSGEATSLEPFLVLASLIDEEELVGHVTDEIDAINSFASAADRIAMDPVRDCFMRADKALSSAEKKVARAVTKLEKRKKVGVV